MNRYFSIAVTKKGDVSVTKEVNKRFHTRAFYAVSKSSLNRVKSLTKYGLVERKRPYLVIASC